MSLTCITEPKIISPVNNYIPIVYSSDNSSETGFKYKLEITDNDNDETIVSLFIFPDVDNSNYLIYNLSTILNDELTSNIKDNWNSTGITSNDNLLKRYGYTITEYIGEISGNTSTTSNLYVYRSVFQYGDIFNEKDYIPYISGTTSGTTNFLTDYPQNKIMKLNEYDTTNIFRGVFKSGEYETSFDRVYIKIVNGITEVLYYYELGTTPETGQIITLPTGTKNINDMVLSGIIINNMTGTPVSEPIITNSTDYYTIDVRSSGYTAPDGNIIKIEIDKKDYKYNGIEFLWLGEKGSYETYKFRMKDYKTFEYERDTYKNNFYLTNGTYNIGDRVDAVNNILGNEVHKVYSNYINDDGLNNKIMTLFNSPEVYIISNNNIYPVIIENNKISSFNVDNNKTWRYSIDFRMAYEKLSNN